MKVQFLRQRLTNTSASSFSDNSLHREMGQHIFFFFFSIVFSPFFLLENNSKQTNCEKAEDPSVQPFSVFTCFVLFFLAHVGSSLPPLLLAWEMSKGRMFTKTSLEGNETFGFTVLDRTRRSTGREGRVKGSKVTVFNSEGFHATAVTNNTHDSRTPCLQLIITILLSLFSFLTGVSFIWSFVRDLHADEKTNKKGKTWSQHRPDDLLLWRY